jgi:Protein of unknown function (DUF559)
VPSRRPRLRLTGPSTRSAAYAAGLSDRDLRHPGVQRLSRDTYLPRALSSDLTARAAAVLLNAPGQAVVSHVTAAELWELGIPGKGSDPRVHLTVETGSAVRNRADRFVHRLPLASDEITRIAGIPVTTATRTWRDLAMELPCPQLLAVTDQLLAGPATAASLEAALRRRPGGRGAGRARAVLRVADALAGSPMESVLRWTLLDAGLPRPVLQHVIIDAAGRFAGRADLAWPALRVLVEFDGDLHRDRDVFVNDLRRQNRLVAAGWTVLRFSSADLLGRPEEVVAEVRAALRRR